MQPSNPNPREAIFVRVTAPGAGGIATFVLDGWGIAAKLQPYWRSKHEIRLSKPGDLFFGRVVDHAGAIVDEGVLAFLDSGETLSGFEQVELSCHGGTGATAAVEEVLERAGFCRATPRQLLFRAHLNNKIPLTSVEAQLALGSAATARQAEFLLGHEVFRKRWERIAFDAAMGMRTSSGTWREEALNAAREALARAPGALALLRTHQVALAGPVNAGKSTLANRLARAERHLVSAIPGTTRDRIDSSLAVRGLALTLSDTAGLRESSDPVELEGQRRAGEAFEKADLRLVVLDGSRVPDDGDLELLARCKAAGPSILVLNKSDLGVHESAQGLGFLAGAEPVEVSALAGTGIDALDAAIESTLLQNIAPQPGDPFTVRQVDVLKELQTNLESGFEDPMIIRCLIKLCGTRANEEQLAIAAK